MFFLGSLDPTDDCVLHVLHRLELGCAVRHAARKIRDGRDKSAAVFIRKRVNDDRVVRTLAHVASVSQEGYQVV